ncbi:hypothetical protein Tco_0536382 [Tanacetum coccineum]
MKDVLATLNSRELKKRTKGTNEVVTDYIGSSEERLSHNEVKWVRSRGDNRTCTIKGTGKVKIQLHDGSSFIREDVRYVSGLSISLISLGTLKKEGYTIKMQMGRIRFKQLGHKQVGFKQLGPGVETGVHEVQDEKRVWFKVELQGAQGDHKAEVFQVNNDDAAVAQRRLEDKQLEEKTNTYYLVKEQEKAFLYAQSACELWKEIVERMFLEGKGHLKLIQFLMKLNDKYESVRSQILAMDHLPNWRKTFDLGSENEIGMGQNGNMDQRLVVAVFSEMMKMFKGKVSFALFCHPHMNVDIGASDHMTPHSSLFISIRYLTHRIMVHLPDGRSLKVTIIGEVDLTPSLIHSDVFYVLEFQLKLLSISKLIQTKNLTSQFFPTTFMFHDLTIKEIVVVGKGSRCLYICKPVSNPNSFADSIAELYKSHNLSISTFAFNKTAFSNVVNTNF